MFPTQAPLQIDQRLCLVDAFDDVDRGAIGGRLYNSLWYSLPLANHSASGYLYRRVDDRLKGAYMEALAVIGGFIAGLGALIISVYTSLNSVTTKQLKAMQEENARLLKRIDAMEVKLCRTGAAHRSTGGADRCTPDREQRFQARGYLIAG